MRLKRLLLVSSLVLATASLAYGIPGGKTQASPFFSTYQSANAWADTANGYTTFSVSTQDMMDGTFVGFVSMSVSDYTTWQYSYFVCQGPAYAKALSVNQGNGTVRISATLDPASPDCFAYGFDQAVVFTLTGQPDGSYYSFSTGTGGASSPGYNERYTSQTAMFGEAFSGTIGGESVSYNGYAYAEHRSGITRVK